MLWSELYDNENRPTDGESADFSGCALKLRVMEFWKM